MVSNLSSRQSMAEWPSFLKIICGETGQVMEHSYSILSFKPSHNLHLGELKLLSNCVILYSSSEGVFSHPNAPSGTQNRLSLTKMHLLKAITDFPAHLEEKCALPGLYVSFA